MAGKKLKIGLLEVEELPPVEKPTPTTSKIEKAIGECGLAIAKIIITAAIPDREKRSVSRHNSKDSLTDSSTHPVPIFAVSKGNSSGTSATAKLSTNTLFPPPVRARLTYSPPPTSSTGQAYSPASKIYSKGGLLPPTEPRTNPHSPPPLRLRLGWTSVPEGLSRLGDIKEFND